MTLLQGLNREFQCYTLPFLSTLPPRYHPVDLDYTPDKGSLVRIVGFVRTACVF